MRLAFHIFAVSAIAGLLVWRFVSGSSAVETGVFPDRPISVVVPYPAGGGSDIFARLLGQAVADEQLLASPFVIHNRPGGSGTIGSRYVKDARPDGYRILCHHESIITAEMSGVAAFGPDAFEPIAKTGGIVLLILVREDATFQTVSELLEAAKAKPKTIRFGANPGSPAHFTAMRLEAALPGARFNLVNSGGGQTRHRSLIGGHLEAGIFSLAEFIQFRAAEGTPPDQNIRVLAVLSDKPHPALPGVSTCFDEGIEVTSSNAYYWWAPKNTPPGVIDTLASALESAMQSEKVREKLSEMSIGLEFTRGEELKSWVDGRIAMLKPLSVRAQLKLPNFPLISGLLVVALGLIVFVNRTKPDRLPKESQTDSSRRISAAALAFVVLLAWVIALQTEILPYLLTTSVMIFLIGALISDWDRSRFLVLAEIAILTSSGTELIFREFFKVALP
ncbi:MAG: tripartite-type tricarboxylate transporter receptor subunit TctC [Verrucomicrobiales bacterium]|jgi:tripartite-type tricarboxylate transporter receptor subunit TctC